MPQDQQIGLQEVQELGRRLDIPDINFIKPEIGEATRVLLRQAPWKILLQLGHEQNPMLLHLRRLATKKQVPVECCPFTAL